MHLLTIVLGIVGLTLTSTLAIGMLSAVLSLPKPVPIVVFASMVHAYFKGFAQAMGVGKEPSTALAVASPPLKRTDDGKEPAYPHYLVGQARRDFQHAQKVGWTRMLKQFARKRAEIQVRWFGRPAEAAPDLQPPISKPGGRKQLMGFIRMVGALVGGGLAIGTLSVAAATQVAMMIVMRLGALAEIAVLRTVDAALLSIRRVRIHCTDPKCYSRGVYPAYECRSCGARHKDVRPGSYGVLRRTCVCGDKLPTLLLLGSHKLKAFCPDCGRPLVDGAGTAPEIVLPVFGATSSGKTRLMLVVMMAIEGMATRRGGKAEFADDATRAQEAEARRALVESGLVRATARGSEPPRSHSIYIKPRRGAARFVHVFDAAGEYFNQTDDLQELRYLKLADTFLFVLDPLSIDSLWGRLGSEDQAEYQAIRAQRDPEFVFAQASTNLTQMGVKTSKARLVVAITKGDLVAPVLAEDGVEDSDRSLQSWMEDKLGQGNLLRAMKLAFGEVRFFLTSAVLDEDGDVDNNVEGLAGWILARHGLRLAA